MAYIIFNTTLNKPVIKIDTDKYTELLPLGADEIAIHCSDDADINDVAAWQTAAANYTGPSAQEKIAIFIDKIQERLDNFARSEGRAYDNMLSACSYATSEHPIYSREGQYCVQIRDTTWAVAYGVMNEVLAGTRPEPTWEEFEAELPKLEWP